MNPRIRAAGPEDADAVDHLVREAFGAEGPQVAALVQALRHSTAWSDQEYVALVDGVIVGHTMVTRSWVDAPSRLVAVGVLSPLSVDPAHQRRGIGTALLAHALRAGHVAGWPAIFLEGDPAYYSTRGVEPVTSRGFSKPRTRIPDAAFQVSLGPTYEASMTGALVYADPFWVQDCVGLR